MVLPCHPSRLVAALVLAALCALALPPATTHAQEGASTDPILAEISNTGAVINRPTRPSEFTLDRPALVTRLATYHWNNATGSPPGWITLTDATGRVRGSWPAHGEPGQGGVPNAYWVTIPMIGLVPGRYTVRDSDPATWSQNAGSGGAGFIWVHGVEMPADTPADTLRPIAEIGNIEAVLNGAYRASEFTLHDATRIVRLDTYHWNDARGQPPGSILLLRLDGVMYGPWTARGEPGQGGVPNAYWVVTPDIILPPGRYRVIDSDPAAWSQNAGTRGAGFFALYGIR